jgi:UDP-N-acetyl-D-glucosamine dehydrogenase
MQKTLNVSQCVAPLNDNTSRLDNVFAKSLGEAIQGKTAVVGIVGLGYVGLPRARCFIEAGYSVLGFDVDPEKVRELQSGRSFTQHIPSDWIAQYVKENKFAPTGDMSLLAKADALLICVPTPLGENRDPDLRCVEAAVGRIAAGLRPGQLIVLESTTYPGTTREVVLPILQKTGLALGKDFFLAYSPEREDPGNPRFTAGNIPKVVGGADAASLELAVQLYGRAVASVVPVSSCEVAEAGKILENTYRAVNIALVNELKVLFGRMGIDVWEVIEAAKTKPFGFQAFYPGPGLGGHCIPVDPFYLTWLSHRWGTTTRLIELAGEINSAMPRHVAERAAEALNDAGKPLKGSRVCLLGAAYKRDVDDLRESPALALIELLSRRGSVVSYNDPHIPRLPRDGRGGAALESEPLTREFLAAQDCAIIVTDHSAYDYDFIVRHSALVVDARNATRGVRIGREKIWKA